MDYLTARTARISEYALWGRERKRMTPTDESVLTSTPEFTREYLSLSQIMATAIDSPMVISYYDSDGRHYQPCLREPSMKRELVIVTMYPIIGPSKTLKLTWQGHGVLVDGSGIEYRITTPNAKEMSSCWRAMARFEDEIMGVE